MACSAPSSPRSASRPARSSNVGDNPGADAEAPRLLGIPAIHLRRFDAASEQRLRLEAAAAAIFEPATRVTLPMCAPHRAAVALREDRDPAAILGHDVFGPLLHTFAVWIKDEAERLAVETGRPSKPLLLLRGG